MRVDHPELDPVAGAVEAHEVGPERRATVQPGLTDALRELGDQQIVAIELVGTEPHQEAAPLDVGSE